MFHKILPPSPKIKYQDEIEATLLKLVSCLE